MSGVRHLWIVRHAEALPDQSGLTAAGERQAGLLGERLAAVPFAAVSHSPLPRAVRTAALVAAHLPGVPVRVAEELDDRVPTDDPAASAAMIARFTGPAAEERHELVVTHAFQVAWFARAALETPAERWRDLIPANTGLTVIRYFPGGRTRVIVFNDLAHLPPELRFTGFPPELRLP
ncbi:histidine phosphatase family protein [Actinoplanes derwentensis]|uniref:Probable phosphoglycerate mutase n=1 Tax=Actinoplanes derwentensis TaxID=113562 RepID=A0A1H2CAX7_9ACTN|nr:histidine phosphatase family protein [Actinoplanes derwentensis]GID89040.1 phosphoglycerate mutase [Actinoplanes derwentensis]SDT67489.1 probable phosphoglycerate mutase [Actinoplanes derwentensis]